MPAALNAIEYTPTDHFRSPLYKLPLEIRARIWVYLMLLHNTESAATAYHPAVGLPYPRYGRPRRSISLTKSSKSSVMKVCHMIRAEVLPIYHRYNDFTFTSCAKLATFLLNISLAERKLLQNLTITWTYRNSYQAYRVLLDCTGLQSLTILLGIKAQLLSLRRYSTHFRSAERRIPHIGTLRELRVVRPPGFELRMVNLRYHLSEGDETKVFWDDGRMERMRKRLRRSSRRGELTREKGGEEVRSQRLGMQGAIA